MKKKSFLMFLSLILVLSLVLAACSQGSEKTSSAPTPSSSKKGSNKTGASTQKPFKISIMADLHGSTTPTDTILKMIEQKTNTKLNIQWVPDGNYVDKMNAEIASGSLPMAMFIKNQASFYLIKNAIQQGQFWNIGPYLKDYSNLKLLDHKVLMNASVDGKIYALYQGRPLSRQGIVYRKDWADKLGLSAPKTTDDLYKMLKAFTLNDPDGNNKNDTIGLADRSDLVYGAFKTLSSYFGTPNNWGLKNGKLEPEFMFPGYVKTMEFMKKLRDKGFMNKDFPVTSKKDQRDMIYNGKAGVYIGSMADTGTLVNHTTQINKNAKLTVANGLHASGVKPGIWSIPGYGSLVLFPKSSIKSEADLKKVLSFFNQLMSPDIANLLWHGIKGKDYTVVNGEAKKSADKALIRREVTPYEGLQIGGYNTISSLIKPYYQYPWNAKAAKLIVANNSMLINDPTLGLDSPTFTKKGAQLQQIIQDATYKFMVGTLTIDGFNKEIEKWKKSGGDKVIAEFNASYKKLHN